jgi:hypothetical protein
VLQAAQEIHLTPIIRNHRVIQVVLAAMVLQLMAAAAVVDLVEQVLTGLVRVQTLVVLVAVAFK